MKKRYHNQNENTTEPAPQEEEKTEPKTVKGVVANCNAVRLRSGPLKLDDNTVRTIAKGEEVEVQDIYDDWCAVKYGPATGYIDKNFLVLKED